MAGRRLRVGSAEPLRRRRLAALFRVPLFLPHSLLIGLWSVLAAGVLVVAWFVLLARGRSSSRLHRLLGAYLRYVGRATAWFFLLSGRYPSPRRTRTHPFVVDVPEPAPQPRLVTLLRGPLAVPALVLASALRVVLTLSSIAAWFTAVALGRTTAGLQELGTFCLRYELETQAYALLLTSRYPRLAPE